MHHLEHPLLSLVTVMIACGPTNSCLACYPLLRILRLERSLADVHIRLSRQNGHRFTISLIGCIVCLRLDQIDNERRLTVIKINQSPQCVKRLHLNHGAFSESRLAN